MKKRESTICPQLEESRVGSVREGPHFGGVRGKKKGLVQADDRRFRLGNVEQLASLEEFLEST